MTDYNCQIWDQLSRSPILIFAAYTDRDFNRWLILAEALPRAHVLSKSLIASATINIGLALVILCLFSVFRKQPANANIYYPRRLALRHTISFDRSSNRFFPSVDWIRDAVRVTEDEILSTLGLDALVLIRFFKLGIKFFVVCSVVGLMVLLPLNYSAVSP
ncbi:unnamed protein product [Lactuca virosa]|uniref:CSC1/OSCA1-like N-terminal transmembrane domain-containing protein n=1 Tax=Lactuca virosa TaxID=75947 RepID=A0AAU9MBG0_9ASTR|nr:unnamed protein product [Lactuca virosa]